MDDVGELPPDLTRVLFNLGTRKLVLLEGASDVAVFQEWYRDRRDVVEFFSPEVPQGRSGVESLLNRILARSTSPNPREYGIVDRDFRDEAEVEAALADPNAHLFILRRYCIENYLLEPAAVSEEVRVLAGYNAITPSPQDMETNLLQMCRRLHPMMAANWAFIEAGHGRHFPEGHALVDRETVIARVTAELGCSQAEAEAALSEREALIEPLLPNLEVAYQRINGKHLLFQLHQAFIRSGINRDQFRNLLARAVKERTGLSQDIKTIIEQRVLA
ncbi:MAG: DUF4435 domain-containing protein [Armatimonadota bacterium]|nr:DUF4435 domain-containing protein [Armatimonadota bacterium]